jgi:hypothetical protein
MCKTTPEDHPIVGSSPYLGGGGGGVVQCL